MSARPPEHPGAAPSARASGASPLARHWSLDPSVAYLNHGSFGAAPLPVLALQARLRERIEREPVTFFVRDLEGLLDEVRVALAAFLGADAGDLVLIANATSGVNTVLRSLPFAPGDELLTTNHAYNACRNALEFVAARSGARAVVADVPFPIDSPDQFVEAVLARVTPRTRIALIDHITSTTALVLPIARIVAALAERGVDTLVDGAHAPGMVPVDIRAIGAAYYTGNCHKWLCAPKGAAFLHVRRDRQGAIHPLTISHGSNSRRADRSAFLLRFDWNGTDDPTAILCVPEALRFLGTLYPGGWPEQMERNRALARAARRTLLAALNAPPPCPEEMLGSMATIPLPDGDAATTPIATDPLQDALLARHGIEVPVWAWPAPPKRVIRVSAQAYNDASQYERLSSALRAELHP